MGFPLKISNFSAGLKTQQGITHSREHILCLEYPGAPGSNQSAGIIGTDPNYWQVGTVYLWEGLFSTVSQQFKNLKIRSSSGFSLFAR